MFRSIIVPVDAPERVDALFPTLSWLARTAHAAVRFVVSREPAFAASSGTLAGVERDPGTSERVRHVERLMERPGSRGPVAIHWSVVDEAITPIPSDAPAADELALSPLEDWVDRPGDSVAFSFAHRPTLLLPTAGGSPGERWPLRAALAPVPAAADLAPVLDQLTAFACITQAHVTLLHVIELADGAAPTSRAEALARANQFETARRGALRRLDLLADRLRCHGIRSAARVVAGADVAVAVLDQLTHGSSDFVVLQPSRGDRPDRSATKEILAGASKPVLLLAPAG